MPTRLRNRGLYPLARGTPAAFLVWGNFHRFIPAGAGNTWQWLSMKGSATVYPRWRGEHAGKREARLLQRGLSPLARGTQHFRGCQNRQRRFIPAGAGNTRSPMRRARNASVYPRWRGEHARFSDTASCRFRFIPAGAGNTSALIVYSISPTVYPRWRGEHSKDNTLFYLPFYRPPQPTNIYITTHLVKERLPC